MEDAKTLYLHIGIPKTASTWLQYDVFPQLDHLRCLNFPQSELFKINNTHPGNHRIMGAVFNLSSHIWTNYGDTIFEELVGNRQIWLKEKRDLLISDEMMGRSGSRPTLLTAHISKMKNKSLEWGFEQFKIIYVIRRQDHWLASHYAQMSDRNPEAGQSDFEKFIKKTAAPDKTRYGFGMLLDYVTFYENLCEVINKSDLLILPYEKLKYESEAFLNELLQYLHAPKDKIQAICNSTSDKKANARSGQEKETWKLRNDKNRKVRRLIRRWLYKKHSKAIEITPEIKRLINTSYSDSNHKLIDKTGISLEQYGYVGFGEY